MGVIYLPVLPRQTHLRDGGDYYPVAKTIATISSYALLNRWALVFKYVCAFLLSAGFTSALQISAKSIIRIKTSFSMSITAITSYTNYITRVTECCVIERLILFALVQLFYVKVISLPFYEMLGYANQYI